MKLSFWAFTSALLLLSISCQKADFLYFQKPIKAGDYLKFEHKLKELQGENKVDVLWTIDNSGSMSSYQRAVADNVNLFMNEFVKSGLEWRMALISTDPRQGYLKPYLGMETNDLFDFKDPNPVNRFRTAVSRLGTGGSGLECGFTPVDWHLKNYPNFTRKDATLALIFVTDAPEQSELPMSGSVYTISPQVFISNLTKTKGQISKAVVYGAFGAQDLNCSATDEMWNYKGSRYEMAVNATKGKYFPLCARDFGTELAKFGKDLSTRITSPRILLKNRPIPETIKVYFHNKLLPGGLKEVGGYWVYDFDRNAILFNDLDFAKDDNEKVNIEFQEMGRPT